MIPDSTNVRVMADNIRKLHQEVEAAAVRIPKDYSETEQNTGVKWIDGKYIYRRIITGTTTADSGNETVATIADVDFVNAQLFMKNTSGSWISGGVTLILGSSTGNIIIAKGGSSAYLSTDYIIYVYYTKQDPVPVNREPDEEPETKKVTKRKTTKGEN